MNNVKEFPKDVLSKEITQKGRKVEIGVYGDGEGGWLLEIVDEYWNSTCWDDLLKRRKKPWTRASML